jgi:serine/threonine-protein kinase
LADARPGLDVSLVTTIERAMAKDPLRRFTSAPAMTAALRGDDVIAAPGTATVPSAVPSPTEVLSAPTARQPDEPRRRFAGSAAGDRRRRLRRHAGAAVAVIVVAVFVFVAVLVARNGGSPSTPSGGTSQPTSVAGSLPEPLDRALKSLEESVRP